MPYMKLYILSFESNTQQIILTCGKNTLHDIGKTMTIKVKETVLIKFHEKGRREYIEYYAPFEHIFDEIESLEYLGAKIISIVDKHGDVIFDKYGLLPSH